MEQTARRINSDIARAILLFTAVLSASALQAQIDMQERISAQASGTGGHHTSDSLSNRSGLSVVPGHFAQLKLAPGFLVSLNVLEDEDFTGHFRIDEKGDITLPELGALHVAGETATEARRQIAKELIDHGILRSPQVEFEVIEYTAPQVTIIGEVASPGVFPLLAPEKLENVLALAGGTTLLASNEIEIKPQSGKGEPVLVHYSRRMDAKESDKTIVHPGETIQVLRAGVVYVLGAVNRPGGYVMQQEGSLSLLQAISIAGGTGVSASTGSVYIFRKNEDNSAIWFEYPYKRMTHGKVADIQLHSNDVVYVPTSRFKATFTNSQSILAAAASASIYAGVIY